MADFLSSYVNSVTTNIDWTKIKSANQKLKKKKKRLQERTQEKGGPNEMEVASCISWGGAVMNSFNMSSAS